MAITVAITVEITEDTRKNIGLDEGLGHIQTLKKNRLVDLTTAEELQQTLITHGDDRRVI